MYNNGARRLEFYELQCYCNYDRSTAESQAFRISDITIDNIGGNVSIRSDLDAEAANAFVSTVFKFSNVSEFIDNAIIGPSFSSASFELNQLVVI